MQPKKPVICIQVGAGGNRIGLSAWEQLLREHEYALFPDKFTEEEKMLRFNTLYAGKDKAEEDTQFTNIFREKEDGKFVPRTLFIDLERPSFTLSELSDSTGENLLKIIQDHESSCSESHSLFVDVCGGLDCSAYTYANGRFSSRSKNLLKIVMERIRLMVEENVNEFHISFMIVSSIGGGLGSGFVSFLMDEIYTAYPKAFKYAISVYPDVDQGDNGPIESLNSLFYLGNVTNGWDAKVFMENKAISSLCMRSFQETSMDSVNELISLVISNITISNRMDASLAMDLQSLTLNLPYPMMNIFYPSFGPIHSSMRSVPHGYGAEMFTYDCLESPFIENSAYGYSMRSSIMYRGYVEPRTINNVIRKLKEQKSIKFVGWNPAGLKLGATYLRPLYSSNSNLLNMHLTVCMLSNSTGLKPSLERIQQRSYQMLTKKSLLNHFHYEGMEMDEITELKEGFEGLIDFYREINAEEERGPDEDV